MIKRDFPKIHFYDQDFVDIYDKTWAWIQDCWSSGNEKVAMLHTALGEYATSDAQPVDEATQAATVPDFPVEIRVNAELSPPVMLADSPMALPTVLSVSDNSTASEEAAEPASLEEATMAEPAAQDAVVNSASVPEEAAEPA